MPWEALISWLDFVMRVHLLAFISCMVVFSVWCSRFLYRLNYVLSNVCFNRNNCKLSSSDWLLLFLHKKVYINSIEVKYALYEECTVLLLPKIHWLCMDHFLPYESRMHLLLTRCLLRRREVAGCSHSWHLLLVLVLFLVVIRFL